MPTAALVEIDQLQQFSLDFAGDLLESPAVGFVAAVARRLLGETGLAEDERLVFPMMNWVDSCNFATGRRIGTST